MIRLSKFLRLIFFSLLLCAGCDTDWPESSEACAVFGTLTLDGRPITDAKVIFIPQQIKVQDQKTKIASGKTDLHGEFTLKVDSRDEKQIRHGRYLVLVSKMENRKELFHESYNRESVLYLEIDSQEAIQRPQLELRSTGTL